MFVGWGYARGLTQHVCDRVRGKCVGSTQHGCTNLVVDDNVDGAANGVVRQRAHVQRLVDDALPRKAAISVQQDAQVLHPILVIAVVLLRPNLQASATTQILPASYPTAVWLVKTQLCDHLSPLATITFRRARVRRRQTLHIVEVIRVYVLLLQCVGVVPEQEYLAKHDGVDSLQMTRVRQQRQMHALGCSDKGRVGDAARL